jgi:accessory gene regulator protein AgrB
VKIGEVLELSPDRRDIVGYGLNVLVSNIFGIAVTLFIAYVMGALCSTFAMIITLLLLRPSAGGAHCSNSFNCSLFGYIFIPLFGYGAFWLSKKCPTDFQYIYLISCTLLVLMGIALKAPYFTQNKPRAEARRKKLKVRALILAILAALASVILLMNAKAQWSTGIATGLLFQGMMLSPPGIKGTLFLDGLVNKIFSQRG